MKADVHQYLTTLRYDPRWCRPLTQQEIDHTISRPVLSLLQRLKIQTPEQHPKRISSGYPFKVCVVKHEYFLRVAIFSDIGLQLNITSGLDSADVQLRDLTTIGSALLYLVDSHQAQMSPLWWNRNSWRAFARLCTQIQFNLEKRGSDYKRYDGEIVCDGIDCL